MANERLFIVYGMGNDAVGLVGTITTPIAEARGNIIDLRQDVLHGQFTLFMVVDLTQSDLQIDGFRDMVASIAEKTGLHLTVDSYRPVPRNPEKKNLRMILIGKDKEGIISASSAMLAKYKANIETAETIGREGIFLMDLLTDISLSTIPVENLMATISENMAAHNIKTIFQSHDVFNNKKRVILFNSSASFLDTLSCREIMQQTGITKNEVQSLYSRANRVQSIQNAVARLDGLPVNVIEAIVHAVSISSDTIELLQTLKTMGYKIVLVSRSFSFLTDMIKSRLNLDYSFGINVLVDDDARTIIGELSDEEVIGTDLGTIISSVIEKEALHRDDVTIITDEDSEAPKGIQVIFNIETILDYYNKKIVSREALLGLLGSFGFPSV